VTDDGIVRAANHCVHTQLIKAVHGSYIGIQESFRIFGGEKPVGCAGSAGVFVGVAAGTGFCFFVDFEKLRQVRFTGFPQNQAGRTCDRKRQAVEAAVCHPQIIAKIFTKILK